MIIIIHLLGLAPTGYLASPNNDAGNRVTARSQPFRCAVEPAESSAVRKPPRRKKTTTQVLEACPGATRVSVDPQPSADRKPPAPLPFFLGTGIDSLKTIWSPIFPLACDLVVIPDFPCNGSPTPSDIEGAGDPLSSIGMSYNKELKITPVQGIKWDRRAAPRHRAPSPGYSTGLMEPCGALPRKCLFIYF
jgi:hypothetical protein